MTRANTASTIFALNALIKITGSTNGNRTNALEKVVNLFAGK